MRISSLAVVRLSIVVRLSQVFAMTDGSSIELGNVCGWLPSEFEHPWLLALPHWGHLPAESFLYRLEAGLALCFRVGGS